jgi:transporter family-2 protein
MTHLGWWFALAVCIGLAQPVLWQMNLKAAEHSGIIESAVVLHVIGALFGILLLLATGRTGSWQGLLHMPWWAWLAGAIGVSGMAILNRAIPIIGIAAALATVVAAQFIASLLFEHTGWLETTLRAVTPVRCVGALFLALGAYLISRGNPTELVDASIDALSQNRDYELTPTAPPLP